MAIIEVNLERNKRSPFQTYTISRPARKPKSILVFTNQTLDAASDNRFEDRLMLPEQCYSLQTILKRDIKNNSQIVVADATHNLSDEYINRMIKKYNATVVVLAGFNIAAPIIKHTPYKTAALQNRVLSFPDRLDAPVVCTWGIGTVFSVNPEKFKTDCNLAGFFAYGMIAADTLKNYTISTKVSYEIVDNLKKFDKFYNSLIKAPEIALDIEQSTDSDRSILTIQICFDDQTAYILPYKCPDTPYLPKEIKYLKAKIKEWMQNSASQTWIMHAGAFDTTEMRKEFEVSYLPFKIWDTMAGEYFLDENRKYMRAFRFADGEEKTPPKFSAYALENILAYYCGGFPYDSGNIGKKQRAFLNRYSYEEYAEYGAKDVLYIFRMKKQQIARARDFGKVYSMYEKAVSILGSDMIHVFSEMRHVGSLMNYDYLRNSKSYSSPLMAKIREYRSELYGLKEVRKTNKILIERSMEAGKVVKGNMLDEGKSWLFNLSEVESSQTLFFDVLKLRPLSVGKSGRPAINAAFISYYRNVKAVDLLSKIRGVEKLQTTYLSDYLDRVNKSPDGRIRAITDFTGVVTARTSSYDPNFQNIPEHSVEAKLIKEAFIATLLGLLLKVDFNAHEVRMWGNVARDKKIAEAFSLGMDIRRKIRIWHIKNYEISHKVFDYFEEVGWEKKQYEEKINLHKGCPSQLRYIIQLYIDLDAKGDVHRRNYEFFYGVPAHKVTKPQRQSVKATVFGALYDKCLVEGSIVNTSKGVFTLGELWENKESVIDKAYVINHKGQKSLISNVIKTQGKTVELKTRLGDTLEGLPEHRMWALTDKGMGFVDIGKLATNDYLSKSIGTNLYGNNLVLPPYELPEYTGHPYKAKIPTKMSEELAYILGFFVSEGDAQGRFHNTDPYILNAFTKLTQKVFKATREINNSGNCVALGTVIKDYLNFLLGEVKSAERIVPNCVLQASKQHQINFLQALFEGDGSIYKHQTSWLLEYDSLSEKLVYQVKAVLENIGIVSKVIKRIAFASNTANKKEVVAWKLRVINQHIPLFQQQVGFYKDSEKSVRLGEASAYIAQSYSHRGFASMGEFNHIPDCQPLRRFIERLEEVCKSVSYTNSYERNGSVVNRRNTYKLGAITGSSHIQLKVIRGQGITRQSYLDIKDKINGAPKELKTAILNDSTIKKLVKTLDEIASYNWVSISTIKATGKAKPVYDLTVPNGQSYHVNGLIGHNSARGIGVTINQEAADKISYDFNLTDREKADLLQPFYDQGEEILNKMFTTFKQGDKWIKRVKAKAADTFTVRSPLGFVRHLCGYYTNIRELLGNMTRRGPNSIIQGMSSNLAYTAARIFQGVKWQLEKENVILDVHINKMVHDSLEKEIRNILLLPLAIYYIEHCLTTLVAKKVEMAYGFSMYINLEAEFNIGVNLANLTTYDYTERCLLKIVDSCLEEAEKRGAKIHHKKKLKKTVLTINRRVNEYRLKELERRDSFVPEKKVLLTPDKVPALLKGLDYDYRNYFSYTKSED